MAALSLSAVSFRYGRGADVLRGFGHTFTPGATLLLGPNGAGKSTVLGLAASALRPHAGQVRLGDVAAGGRSLREFRRRVAWMPQRIEAFPSIAIEPLWVRHLTGQLIDCCDVATVPAGEALLAPALIAAAAVAAAALLLARLPIAVRIGLAGAALAAGVGTGVALVSGLGSEPTAPRSAADLVCAGSGPRVCLWPEHRSLAARVRERARLVHARLRARSVPVPDTVSEAHADWSIGVTPEATREAIDGALVKGLLPRWPACADGPQPYPGYEAYRPVALWLAQAAGVTTADIDAAAEPADRAEVAAVRRLPSRHQLAWYGANVDALSTCGLAPRLVSRR